uniref:Essential MCU regulator, mitochondrial n=1 Tax=Hucho hucho TaxID=62062 RepID=A0A4W5PKI8_9TELE
MELLTIVQTSFGLFRIAVVVILFLYVGTRISKNFAALLEERDIFVPEDDDDDDLVYVVCIMINKINFRRLIS